MAFWSMDGMQAQEGAEVVVAGTVRKPLCHLFCDSMKPISPGNMEMQIRNLFCTVCVYSYVHDT